MNLENLTAILSVIATQLTQEIGTYRLSLVIEGLKEMKVSCPVEIHGFVDKIIETGETQLAKNLQDIWKGVGAL